MTIIFLNVSQVKRWKKPISSPFFSEDTHLQPSHHPFNPRICRMNCQLSSRAAGLIKPGRKIRTCGKEREISLSQWTLSFKSLNFIQHGGCMGICGWEKCETLFSLPNMYVIICNPKKLKVWAIGQNVRKQKDVPLIAWSRTRKNAPSLRFQKIDSWFKRYISCNKNCLIVDGNHTLILFKSRFRSRL